ncbi:ras-associated and pleckstrin homology domains-containing protein 1-like isoform X2 [Limulus polyphemus]|uniref:Ras-associated and pleckstrin homology domains-containing protein 1-like isoform X2 n=2 Tax=Limulus polyphemus TaxID=6850 RepID=A0ABM1S1W4_LIMPO|nr:ras-associated and pleckstrin homology domains-containing protein 1-like isoform X2 [Limulus polyphemus]
MFPKVSLRSTMECEDSNYSSNSDAELDSDDDPNDPQKLLAAWMTELDDIRLGVDNESTYKTTGAGKHNLSKPSPRMDSYRLSMANLESSQDVELDAILGELCALGSHFDREMHRGHARSVSGDNDGLRLSNSATEASPEIHRAAQQISRQSGNSHSSSGGSKTKFEIGGPQVYVTERDEGSRGQKHEFGLRTDSPDNDSAFSDNVSMLSSESSASSGVGANRSDVSSQNIYGRPGHVPQTSQSSQDDQARIKSEKIKLAMEKIQESNIKKVFIRAYTDDDSTKSLLVDERMNIAHVCRLLAEKNHTKMDLHWAVVERDYDLHLDRMFEDHENLVENILMWTQDATHKLLFQKKEEKYDVFANPEDYLLGCTSSQKGAEMDDEGKATLIEEFFSATRIAVPEMEGNLYLKSDGKKAWKKYFFVLRASGLYYNPKGKSKLSKDLVCLTGFEVNNIYKGFGWRKKYKAPTDFCFAIKHPEIQVKCCRSIKFLCAEDLRTLKLWMTGIRIAKYGHQMKENYDNVLRDIDEEDLDTLANARSFSVSSMAKTLSINTGGVEILDQQDHRGIEQKSVSRSLLKNHTELRHSQDSDLAASHPSFDRSQKRSSIIRRDSIKSSASSSSSGCSSVSTPTNDQIAFEADFPVGTIKRKPNMAPKIPLTSTTRTIAKQSMSDDSRNNVVNLDTVQESNKDINATANSNTLGRNSVTRLSLRRSHTEDKINVNGVAKIFQRKHSVDSGTLTRQIEELHAIGNGTSNIETASTDSRTVTPVNSVGDVDDLPLPPPPPELETSEEIFHRGMLPPPPPEAFSSTLSLDSLPPPPPSLQLDDQSSWPSTSSLNSLPPLPNEVTHSPKKSEENRSLQWNSCIANQNEIKTPQNAPVVPPKPKKQGRERRLSEADSPSSFSSQLLTDRKQSQSNTSPRSAQKPQQKMDSSSINCYGTSPRSGAQHKSPEHPKSPKHGSLKRGISFSQSPTESNRIVHFAVASSPSSPQFSTSDATTPNIYQKPNPPKRNETTKLSHRTHVLHNSSSGSSCSEQEHQQSNAIPPEFFLRDLHRVMEKKWKVAQQLSVDLTATPHQIMGFRDPCFLPPEGSVLTHSALHSPPTSNSTDYHSKHRHHHHSQKSLDGHSKQTTQAKKKPPPPPPKRSETTHLTVNIT